MYTFKINLPTGKHTATFTNTMHVELFKRALLDDACEDFQIFKDDQLIHDEAAENARLEAEQVRAELEELSQRYSRVAIAYSVLVG